MPARFVSPVDVGEPWPPPSDDANALRSLVLSDQERYRSVVFIEADRCMATGADIAGSFADGCMTEGVFIDAFATFLLKEMRDRPQTYGKRVFIPTIVVIILPVMNNDHWSLYIINFMHKRIDVLDSNEYNAIVVDPVPSDLQPVQHG
ncbi:hypothetical protein E2562_038143 [Oryza meyeriana var. granulata]|uniref:Ubiquitin-like protease family profile domain-containing protein n=1 Tax=Oryza meyeriana var. granulata TaxID=110450 RepID=A0A6G1BQV3_9ORYZ|nr:hypothetical protein E2562_038143 [Oryza meyeriana var. granulata]